MESMKPVFDDNRIRVDEDVHVYPVGLKNDTPLSQKIFSDPAPAMFNEEELRQITKLLWVVP